jgi:hypothetical protein
MQKNTSVVRIAGAVLSLLILVAVAFVVGISPALAGGPPDQSESTQGTGQEEQRQGDVTTPPPCNEPVPCAINKPPKATDKASDGSACTSGNACRLPDNPCGVNNTGHCVTYPLGQGKCACGCMGG